MRLKILFFLLHFNHHSFSFQEKIFKFPNKPKPLYPIDGEYLGITGVAVSPINEDIFFCDETLGQIFKISGEQQYLVAGDSASSGHKDGHLLAAKFNGPQGISLNPSGTLLAVADRDNHVIRIVDLTKGIVSTLAGKPGKSGLVNGIGSEARFNYPMDVSFDTVTGAFVYVADTFNSLVRKIVIASGNVTSFTAAKGTGLEAASGIAADIHIKYPFSVFHDRDKSLYISEAGNFAVRVINDTGYIHTIYKNNNFFSFMTGIIKKNGSVYVVDNDLHVIVAIEITSKTMSIYAGAKGLPGFYDGQRLDAQLHTPLYMALTRSNDILVGDYFNNAIRIISETSGFLDTIIKNRNRGYVDGDPEIAKFAYAHSIELDPKRSILYVVDSYNNAVRRIHLNENYRVDTLAGKPYSGFADGSLDDALFNNPNTMFLSPSNPDILYLSDQDNYSIRLIDLVNGIVTSPWKFDDKPNGFTLDADGNLYAFMMTSKVIYLLGQDRKEIIAGSSSTGCKDGPALSASLGSVFEMAYHAERNEIIISDNLCNSIRSFSLNSRSISTVAGQSGENSFGFSDGPNSLFSQPFGMSFGPGKIYIVDKRNEAIRSMSIIDNNVTTIMKSPSCGYRNGNSKTALLCSPSDVAHQEDLFGTEILYIADTYNNAIRMIKKGQVTTIAGPGSPIFNSSKSVPNYVLGARGIIVLEVNNLLLADTINNCIMSSKIVNDSTLDLKVIVGDGSNGWKDGLGTDAMLNWPTDMALTADQSTVFIADSKNHAIRRLQLMTRELSTYAGSGFEGNDIKPELRSSTFNDPQAIAIDPISNDLYVADSGNNCIKKINVSTVSILAGSFSAGFKNGVASLASFAGPMGIAYDPDTSSLYVSDTFNHAIRKIDSKRNVTTVTGYTGTLGYIDGALAIAKFNYPTKICIESIKKRLLVLDYGNHAIRILDTSNNVSTLILDPESKFQGLSSDTLGNIYISDAKSIRVFYNSQINTSSIKDLDPKSDFIVIAFIISLVVSLTFAVLYVNWRVKSSKMAKSTIKVLKDLRNIKKSTANAADQSSTISPSKTVAFAIPGYLRVKLKKTVFFPDNFEISGMGGTAQVIRCKLIDPKLIQEHGIVDVVVKIFSEDTSNESFLYEVMVMNSLPKSPNLIQLIGYSEELSIIMKDYPFSLKGLLEDKAFINTQDVNLKIAFDIANGMNLIHQKGIIHYDLKPANILAESVNGTMNYVICDFGFANFISDVQDRIVKGVKRPNTVGITARYAAPELFSKIYMKTINAPADLEKKIDVYAYGMTMFYVFLRRIPLQDLSLSQIEDAVIAGKRPEIPSASTLESIEKMIKSCWSQDPNDRPEFTQILKILETLNTE